MDDCSWSGLHWHVCEKTLGVLNASDFMAPLVLYRSPFDSSQRQLLRNAMLYNVHAGTFSNVVGGERLQIHLKNDTIPLNHV